MTCKIYVYDKGWAGAKFTIQESFEDAVKVLLLDSINYYKQADKDHIEAEQKGREPRDNPWPKCWKHMEDNPQDYISEYDIYQGLIIEAGGE